MQAGGSPEQVDDDDESDDGDASPSGIDFRIERSPRKSLRMATWDTSSLFGAVLTAGGPQHRKTNIIEDILWAHVVIALTEARGTSADLTTLPLPLMHVCWHLASASSAEMSDSGGTTITVRSPLADKVTRRIIVVRSRGRSLTHSLCIGQGAHFSAGRVDPLLSLLRRQQVLASIHMIVGTQPGTSFLFGDWSLVHSDETHLLSSGANLRPDVALARHFGDSLSGHIELRKQEHTFRRIARYPGAPTLFSRIDIAYTNLHP